MANRIEKRPDIGVKYIVHLTLGDAYREGVQRIVRSPSGPEPIGEPEEIFLVDGVQHHNSSALDDFVFQGGDRQWPLPSVRLWNIRPARRLGPISPAMNA